jgi:hypothetical protein
MDPDIAFVKDQDPIEYVHKDANEYGSGSEMLLLSDMNSHACMLAIAG